MKKMFRPLTFLGSWVLIAGLAASPDRAAAGVYDDCVAWWHFDYDPDADGLADLDEIRDQRDWGTATVKGATGSHATGVQGLSGSPKWTNSVVVCPAGGQDYGKRSMLFRPAVDANTNCWPDTFRVAGLGLAGSATLVTRFRWDGTPTPVELSCWFYNNHLEWNAYRGWLFGVASSYPRLTLYTQKATTQMDVAVTNGVWYDAAMVLTDGGETNPTDTVEFYLWKEGEALQYQKKTTTAITNSINPSPVTIVGSEVFGGAYASGNSRKAFSGEVNHLAVWNRALSAAEVNQAFGNPQPLFQIGLKNNNIQDLRVESETDAEYWLGDPWHTMRRALTGGATDATLKLPLTAQQAGLDYVYHLRTQSSEPNKTAELRLIVNSLTNAVKTAGAEQDLYWFIPHDALLTGTNTVTLNYVAGPAAYVSFDWLELAGAWQVGYDNNSQAEFIIESGAPDDFYVTDPNWMHLERALTVGDPNINLHFALSPELMTKYFFRYTTRVISQGQGQHPVSIGINGKVLKDYPAMPDGTLITLPFEREDMRSGDNTVNLIFGGTNGWLQFDFHRLELAEAPRGTLIIMH